MQVASSAEADRGATARFDRWTGQRLAICDIVIRIPGSAWSSTGMATSLKRRQHRGSVRSRRLAPQRPRIPRGTR